MKRWVFGIQILIGLGAIFGAAWMLAESVVLPYLTQDLLQQKAAAEAQVAVLSTSRGLGEDRNRMVATLRKLLMAPELQKGRGEALEARVDALRETLAGGELLRMLSDEDELKTVASDLACGREPDGQEACFGIRLENGAPHMVATYRNAVGQVLLSQPLLPRLKALVAESHTQGSVLLYQGGTLIGGSDEGITGLDPSADVARQSVNNQDYQVTRLDSSERPKITMIGLAPERAANAGAGEALQMLILLLGGVSLVMTLLLLVIQPRAQAPAKVVDPPVLSSALPSSLPVPAPAPSVQAAGLPMAADEGEALQSAISRDLDALHPETLRSVAPPMDPFDPSADLQAQEAQASGGFSAEGLSLVPRGGGFEEPSFKGIASERSASMPAAFAVPESRRFDNETFSDRGQGFQPTPSAPPAWEWPGDPRVPPSPPTLRSDAVGFAPSETPSPAASGLSDFDAIAKAAFASVPPSSPESVSRPDLPAPVGAMPPLADLPAPKEAAGRAGGYRAPSQSSNPTLSERSFQNSNSGVFSSVASSGSFPPASASMAIPLPGHNPPPQGPMPYDEVHYREVFDQFVAAKERLGESTERLRVASFSKRLQGSERQLIEKHGCRAVRFQVVEKGGSVSLRPQLVR